MKINPVLGCSQPLNNSQPLRTKNNSVSFKQSSAIVLLDQAAFLSTKDANSLSRAAGSVPKEIAVTKLGDAYQNAKGGIKQVISDLLDVLNTR